MFDFIKQYTSMRSFQKLPEDKRRIVFYSEGSASWPHLSSIALAFLEAGHQICWLSSDKADPGLLLNNKNCLSFYIGDGVVRIFTFTALDCGVLLTSSPDLDQNQIKRSRFGPLYVYVHHSLVSHHMVYRPKAFAAFDVMLCAGPHHVRELEEEESYYLISKRKKIKHGYGRLDYLIQQIEKQKILPQSNTNRILIAPSWGKQGLIEADYIRPLLSSLFAQGFAVTLRPHPRSFQFAADKIRKLSTDFPELVLDKDITSDTSLLGCDVLISDWSGVALEYAFSRLRPVVFIDTTKKILNLNYHDINILPLEITIRKEIGVLLPLDKIENVAQVTKDLIKFQDTWAKKIIRIREQTIFNIGGSAEAARDGIIELLS